MSVAFRHTALDYGYQVRRDTWGFMDDEHIDRQVDRQTMTDRLQVDRQTHRQTH